MIHSENTGWAYDVYPVYNYIMSSVKKIVSALVFMTLFLLCGMGFRWLLIDDTQSYTRLMMHEFYEQENIDNLFVGSSHCYAALDPAVTDKVFGANSFNAGSSLQALDASFALIREAAERYDLKHIYLEMYYLMMSNDNYKERDQLTGTYIISDYMRPSFNKAKFLFEASAPKYYVNSFLPARRNWEKLLHPSEVLALIREKQKEAYRNYEPIGGYRAKGFVSNQGEIPNGILLDTAGFDSIHTKSASPDWLKTLREIINYCEKKGISLTLFSAPMTLFQTAGVGNYDDYIELINHLIEGTNAEYVDFNLCREEYFDQTPDLFADAGHLNERGAEVFSQLFASHFSGAIAKDELFYESMAEKIAAHGPDILGLSYLDSGDGMRKLKIVSTCPPGSLYSVEFCTANGDVQRLKDNSSDLYFEIPQETHGTIHVFSGEIEIEVEV
ncbi:MAG: hypothetical protein II969_16345 [Anaerolineaceae bacterium]|nr:hypothetical protein [Anaerolineaceae bacterium]